MGTSIFLAGMTGLLAQAPYILVSSVGVVAGMIYYGRYKTPALFVILGCLAFFLTSIISPFLQTAVFQLQREQRADHTAIALWTGSIALLSSVTRAAGLALLIAAAFQGRVPRKSETTVDGPRDAANPYNPPPL